MTKKKKTEPKKARRSPPMTHRIDISRAGEFSAQLILKTQFGMQAALGALKLAVGIWLETTEAGRAAWQDSCEDFNYGDLSMHIDNPELKKLLRKEGIISVQIEQFCAEKLNESWDTIIHPTDGVSQ